MSTPKVDTEQNAFISRLNSSTRAYIVFDMVVQRCQRKKRIQWTSVNQKMAIFGFDLEKEISVCVRN